MKIKMIGINPSRVQPLGVKTQSRQTEQLNEEMDNVIRFLCEHSNGPDNMVNKQEALDMLLMFKKSTNPEKLSMFDKAAELVEVMIQTMIDEVIVIYNDDDWALE